jgi:hypothetical protein
MTRSKLSRLAITTLVFGLLASPKSGESTSIIIIRTATSVIIGADSRGTIPGSRTGAEVCKISVATNGILSVLFGLIHIGSVDILQHTPGIVSARSVTSQQNLHEIAQNWTDFVRESFEEMKSSDGVRRLVDTQTKEGRITFAQAVFLGFDKDGFSIGAIAIVRLKKNAAGKIETIADPVADLPAATRGMAEVKGFGYGDDTLEELKAGKTPRSKANSLIFRDLEQSKTQQEREKAVKELTELAGSWYPEEVGGPTDIAVMRADGVTWAARKAKCPPDTPK